MDRAVYGITRFPSDISFCSIQKHPTWEKMTIYLWDHAMSPWFGDSARYHAPFPLIIAYHIGRERDAGERNVSGKIKSQAYLVPFISCFRKTLNELTRLQASYENWIAPMLFACPFSRKKRHIAQLKQQMVSSESCLTWKNLAARTLLSDATNDNRLEYLVCF